MQAMLHGFSINFFLRLIGRLGAEAGACGRP